MKRILRAAPLLRWYAFPPLRRQVVAVTVLPKLPSAVERYFSTGSTSKVPDRHDHLTSWADPMDFPMDDPEPEVDETPDSSKEPAAPITPDTVEESAKKLWTTVEQLPSNLQIMDLLATLGVHTLADLRYVGEQDLLHSGLTVVDARKLLRSVSPIATSVVASRAPVVVAKTADGIFNAEETMKLLAQKSIISAQRPVNQILCSSFLGGALLGWGGALTTVVAGGSATALATAPGALALLTGAVFPVGLSMIVLSGSELLTGNFMLMALPAWTHPSISKVRLAWGSCRVLSISCAGNLLGSLFVACAIFGLSVVTIGSPAALWLSALAVKKCGLSSLVVMGKGVGANWLVNVAIFQASSAHSTAGKIASLWLPVMTFVALGLEHSIANMFLLPLAMFLGADITALDIAGNIIPAAVGNAFGAIFFVAGVQRFSLLRNLAYSKRV